MRIQNRPRRYKNFKISSIAKAASILNRLTSKYLPKRTNVQRKVLIRNKLTGKIEEKTIIVPQRILPKRENIEKGLRRFGRTISRDSQRFVQQPRFRQPRPQPRFRPQPQRYNTEKITRPTPSVDEGNMREMSILDVTGINIDKYSWADTPYTEIDLMTGKRKVGRTGSLW